MDEDGLTDIVLITTCKNENKAFSRDDYKVGEVLFRKEQGFYRDWRISDKINRFSMNKSIRFITSLSGAEIPWNFFTRRLRRTSF